jgi:hypothetical protein
MHSPHYTPLQSKSYLHVEWSLLFKDLMTLGFEFQLLPRAEVFIMHNRHKYFHESMVHLDRQHVKNLKTRAVHRDRRLRVNLTLSCQDHITLMIIQWNMTMERWWNDTDGETEVLATLSCPRATLSTPNLKRTGLRTNPGFRGERPVD